MMTKYQQWLSPLSILEECELFCDRTARKPQETLDLALYEDEEAVTVEAAMPGISKEQAEITFDQGILTIRGEKQSHNVENKRTYYARAQEKFLYRLAIPGNIEQGQDTQAILKDGIMKVIFQKKRPPEPKRISIQGSE